MKKKLFLHKMKVTGFPKLKYKLGDIVVNDLVGQEVKIKFTGQIKCVNCENPVNKTFNQGYCYPCFMSLASCDMCIMKPELCHYKQGTCREPEWGEEHCLQDHIVYLANSTGLKVGITREKQLHTRWADQGAVQAVAIARVPERLVSGQLEVALKEYFNDRTNWRKLLKGEFEEFDLKEQRNNVIKKVPKKFQKYVLDESEAKCFNIKFPVDEYPKKAKSFNAEKSDVLEGKLLGIRGQYLLFEEASINIRKYQGYEVEILC